MNKKTHAFAILLCLVLASLAGISVRISDVKSSPSATLSLQPATVTGPSSSVNIGKTFNLTLYVTNVTNLWSWKVAVSWDPRVLNLTSSPTEGSFMGGGTLFLAHPTNYTGGSIPELSDTYLSNKSISGSGVLANMAFKIIGPPGSNGSVIGISDAVILDPSTPHNNIAFTTQNATLHLTTLSLQPTAIIGRPPTTNETLGHAIDLNKTFTVSLYVHDVTNLWSWKVAISWDPSVLNLTSSPTEGSFMGGGTLFLAHPTNYTGGSIPELSDTYLSTKSQSGSGILAVLTFKVIGYSWNGSVIRISDAVILDPSTPHNNIAFTTTNTTFTLPPIGDLGGGVPPQFFKFDGKVDGKDLALFLQCYHGTAPADAMYLGDLGGGVPPKFFAYDGIVDGKDLALFLQCYHGTGPLGV